MTPANPSPRPERAWPAALALSAITLLAFGLRAYRLSEVPAWYDDLQCIPYLGAPGLGAYLALVRFLNPDHLPLYFVLEYCWVRIAGTSPFAVRLLPVLLSTAAVPCAYLLARRIRNGRAGMIAGLIAALCLALSPLHIWYGQATRYNALMDVLALVSIYALLRIKRDGAARWWLLNLGVNLLLLATHLLAGLLVAVEFCFLMLYARRHLKAIAAWCAGQAVLVFALLVWLQASYPYTVSTEEDFYYVTPRDLAIDLVGDDAITLSQSWMFFSAMSRYLPPNPRAPFLTGPLNRGMNAVLMLTFANTLVWTFSTLACARWKKRRESPISIANEPSSGMLLLLLIAVLPSCALYTISRLFHPCLTPQYTLYSSVALYILLGSAIAGMDGKAARGAAIAALMLLYGFQLAAFLPEQTRTDWRSAARQVKAHATTDDLILVRGRYFANESLRFSMGATEVPIVNAYSLEAICDKSARFLKETADASRPARSVWAVIEVSFDYPPLPLDALEEHLEAAGLRYVRNFFPGMGGLAVYQIQQSPEPVRSATVPNPIPVDVDYDRVLADLAGGAPMPASSQDESRATLAKIVENAPPKGSFTFAQFAIMLADEGCLDLAEAAARKSLQFRSYSAFGYFALAIVLGEKDDPGAASAFDAAIAADRIHMFPLYRGLFNAVYVQKDQRVAQKEIATLDHMGAFIPQILRTKSGLLPIADRLKSCR